MWLVVVLITVTFILHLIFKQLDKSRNYRKFMSAIPGPKGWPLIGNLSDILTTREQIFASRRKWAIDYYPIYKFKICHIDTVNLINPEDIEKLLTNMKHNEKGIVYDFLKTWLTTGLLTSTGSKWKTRRRILTPSFHFNILNDFISIFNRETEDLVEVLSKECNIDAYIDVMQPITQYTLYCIMETSMGVKLKEDKFSDSYKDALYHIGKVVLQRISRPWLAIKPIYMLSSTYRKEKHSVNVLHNFSRRVIEDRKSTFDPAEHNSSDSTKKRQAMLDLLLSAQHAGADIDDNGIREEVDTFLFAGHDTTSTNICFALMLLANEPEIQEKVLEEIYKVLGTSSKVPTYSDLRDLSYMERCIKEVMRLYPSIPVITRIAGEDMKTPSGYMIPKGTNVHVFIYDLHRSPHIWENPEKFDPDRFLPENASKRHSFSFLPFSAGYRNCLGQKFAFLEIKAALCGILRKFKLEPVDTPQTVQFLSDIALRPCNKVRVKFVPRY